ncbi:hypothetical protein UFOVP1522_2 [uncultured Caudovirales phage]|uniref:Uncharacterized protein n=1 Tax=uncultured Caudovirales phage TaxID=2100421 RepID=A0A6J7XAK0_9CAUD|nr:hypothetical protein UFOVP989_21 [uncultured Caudovirales phage]CAB4181516.1 hypothetical protein UFOVP1075_45 [uncultured Caudovirales phage]CAB4198746.1 hypothetical protein UFOVP1312_37 [uncultured Caudovirales phage]CAB4210556.1 hypothetical protein UFOVP1426_21 [uncultured Caudovirales phage]CAB5227111.1 hypothetical protein UFOVP1522_2 [uncultured Caudovirales phage]
MRGGGKMNEDPYEIRRTIFKNLPVEDLVNVQNGVNEELERLNRDASMIGEALMSHIFTIINKL